MQSYESSHDLVAIGLQLQAMLHSQLSQNRFLHSQRVARTASLLADTHGIARDRAWLAGMAHDWAREWPHHESLHFLANHGQVITAEEHHRPVLLHGRIAAVQLVQHYGLDDDDIAEAVSHHTLGGPGMGPLAKLLFVADYLEPGRKFTSPQYRRLVRGACLNCMIRLVIEHNLARHGDLHLRTKQMYDEAGSRCTTGICREWRWQGHE